MTDSSPDLHALRAAAERLREKLQRDICRLGPSCDNGNYTVSQLTLDEARQLLALLSGETPEEEVRGLRAVEGDYHQLRAELHKALGIDDDELNDDELVCRVLSGETRPEPEGHARVDGHGPSDATLPQGTGDADSYWQPIETAPPTAGNGRHVLLYVPQYGTRSLIVEGWVNDAHPGRPWVAENGGQIQPTHWMPLWPAPSETKEQP